MKIKIFGVEIFISFWFAALLAAMLFFDRSGLVMPTILLALFHETAHLLAMSFCGSKPKNITLKPGRIEIHNQSFNDISSEIIILMSGPLLNIISAGVLYFVYMQNNSKTVVVWSAVSLVLGVYNLFPIHGLDGGSIVYVSVCRKYGPITARKALSFCSLIFTTSLLVVGVLILKSGEGNVSLLIFGCYLIILYAIKR